MEKFRVWDLVDWISIFEGNSFEELLIFVAKRGDSFFDNITMNYNDKWHYENPWNRKEDKFFQRRYMILDNYGRIIDLRYFRDEISRIDLNKLKEQEYENRVHKGYSSYLNNKFVYRFDPVPGVHKYPHSRWFRRPRTTQERRMNLDPDHARYSRKRRSFSSLVNSWHDEPISRRFDRSWKTNKKSKQWM